MALPNKLKDWLITIGIYGSILIPMFIMIQDPQIEEQLGAQQTNYQAAPLVAQFVVMRKKHADRVKALGLSPIGYKDRYIAFYADEYPQLLVDGKVAVKVGTLKVFFDRLDLVGVAPVYDKNRIPPFGEVQPVK